MIPLRSHAWRWSSCQLSLGTTILGAQECRCWADRGAFRTPREGGRHSGRKDPSRVWFSTPPLCSTQLLIFNLFLHRTCFVFAFTAIWKIETNAPSLAKLTDVDWGKKKRWRKYSLGLSFESVNPINSQGTALWNRSQWFLLCGSGKEPTTLKVSLFKNNAFT